MLYLSDCGYCSKAFHVLDELYSETPSYRMIPINKIEESEHPALVDQYDSYAVPSFFDGNRKLFEAHFFMSYEEIRIEIRRVLDYALSA